MRTSRVNRIGEWIVDRQRLGLLVRRRREELGLTQLELAAAAGWHVTAYNVLENGRRQRMPPYEMMERLAKALDLPIGTLMAAAGYGDDAAKESEDEARHGMPAVVASSFEGINWENVSPEQEEMIAAMVRMVRRQSQSKKVADGGGGKTNGPAA